MQVTGKVKVIGEVQTFGTSGFKKRELVITTNEQYPQTIMIEFVQDKTDLLNNLKINQDISVDVDLRGREWVNPQGESKYFNSINGWRVEVKKTLEEGAKVIDAVFPPAEDFNPTDKDDLPF